MVTERFYFRRIFFLVQNVFDFSKKIRMILVVRNNFYTNQTLNLGIYFSVRFNHSLNVANCSDFVELVCSGFVKSCVFLQNETNYSFVRKSSLKRFQAFWPAKSKHRICTGENYTVSDGDYWN